MRQCSTCSLYNQIPLSSGTKRKGTKRNVIWQMDVFHFTKFGKLKCVLYTVDTYSRFQRATALTTEKADTIVTYLLEVMAIMGISTQIKTDNGPAYIF